MLCVWIEDLAFVPVSQQAVLAAVAGHFPANVGEGSHDRSRLTHLGEAALAHMHGRVQTLRTLIVWVAAALNRYLRSSHAI